LWNCHTFVKNFKTKTINPAKLKLKDEDRWILSRLNNTIKEVTQHLEKHSYNSCYNYFKEFVENDFSRFYIKLIRERALDADDELIFTMGAVMNCIVKLMAPFSPYLTDKIYLELCGKKASVHLEDWPSPVTSYIDMKLEDKFKSFKDLLQVLLSEREKTGLGIRWPLQKVTIKGLNVNALKDLTELIKIQVNVKEVLFVNDELNQFKIGNEEIKFKVEFDKTPTKELEEEGYFREIMRRIQDLRKKNNLKREDKIDLDISFNVNLKSFEKDIKERAGVKILTFGKHKYKNNITGKIKDKEFEINFEVL
jgi:isoleucyl-tRNA synthetase